MTAKLKTIAFFGCSFTSRYRQNLCRCFNKIAEDMKINIVYINSLGKIGNKNAQYGDYEFDLIEMIDLNQFDGIIFDGEGYNVEGMADKVIRKLREAICPVISISTHVEGFYNIEFNDTGGIRTLIEHFIDHHHFTKIGFMSGYLSHPDAQARLKEFQNIMQERGFPENGAGMFEGDFWFHKGNEAAEYFLSLPERPEAIVCANDYMAISLITAFKKHNINVPGDIAVSGFDGTFEGQEFLPHLTSATREREQIARKSLTLFESLWNKKSVDIDLNVTSSPIFNQSCGCKKLDYKFEAENVNRVYEINRNFSYNLYDAESALLKLNKVDSLLMLGSVFIETSINFGDYNSFFLMLHKDTSGKLSSDSDFHSPSGEFTPAVWIDKKNEYTESEHSFSVSSLIPKSSTNLPHFFYIMSVHCVERMFGYAVIEMSSKDIFNEFYNVWLLNMAMTIETLYKNDKIIKLISELENLSIRDGLTGMLNRRGFDDHSREAIRHFNSKRTVCTMVIDMDGLKHINDVYGHYEGDRAIKSAAEIINQCCDSGEIAGRAGGDEFYIFAPRYSQKQLDRFVERMQSALERYNRHSNKPYNIELSYGAFLIETDNGAKLEDYIKISDSRMYEQKLSKPGRRK
ncbi:GGDEF domain-containing protein [Ruminococcus sp.]|uniref:substrate-binding and GGDEF domain-containing protein n=1 Tax=Ruminococcus sp. TaxID=41978 RepID=UPI0025E5B06F|nr:GGDEF domain-containing protein [Ruminococcus sp.]